MSGLKDLAVLLERQQTALRDGDWESFRSATEQISQALSAVSPLSATAEDLAELRAASATINQSLEHLRIRIEQHARQLRTPTEAVQHARIVDQRG